MTTVDERSSLAKWVIANPGAARVFHKLELDFCCGGQSSLLEACKKKGIEIDTVVQQIVNANSQAPDSTVDWNKARLVELCEHIVETHHGFLRDELPRLTSLMNDVLAAHGDSMSELRGLEQALASLVAELEPHMMKEERVLFPAIRLLEESAAVPNFPFGSVGNPISVMEHEHSAAGDALATMRRITNGFHVPSGACAKLTALYEGLARLEEDMHLHVHKENNILFPRAVKMEQGG